MEKMMSFDIKAVTFLRFKKKRWLKTLMISDEMKAKKSLKNIEDLFVFHFFNGKFSFDLEIEEKLFIASRPKLNIVYFFS